MSAAIRLDQLATAVRQKRGDRSLKAVEDETEVSASTLSRVERGHVPDIETIEKLADWLGVSVKTGAREESGIRTDEDLKRTVEVYLRAEKKLPEGAARTIAQAVTMLMDWEIEKAKREDT